MQSLIELKNITKSFEDDMVLENFNLTVNRNEFINPNRLRCPAVLYSLCRFKISIPVKF